MVGTVEPRKGHALTLDAFEQFWSAGGDATLVIAGKQGWGVDALCARLRQHPQSGKRLIWLDKVSDTQLQKLYSTCSCLIAASEGEGFGLPLIEAARYKVPILARNLPVFREVAGQYATYFDCETAECLASALTDWLIAYSKGKVQTSDGMPMLTWAESAQKIMDIILERAKSYSQSWLQCARFSKFGPVTYLCRSKCSFKPPFVRKRPDFSIPMLNADGVGCRCR